MVTKTAMPAEEGPDLLPVEEAAAVLVEAAAEASAIEGTAVMTELEAAGVAEVVGIDVEVVVGMDVVEVGEVGEEVEKRFGSTAVKSLAALRAVSVVIGKGRVGVGVTNGSAVAELRI